ncbi:uncharacterized protein M421DRAFT_421622 [Didymella exigua CBS 183.55]|uniref:Uncharacterized protein n=1 Tax=Didymella exigua CBS 183.55 TaxID=1150837 RepID=A0A6A5RHG3_9PLEO|nr:uncharacterized protein M421DRAFT_421622 [Didymella exigua CBS 183.55]KAF1927781.1 hypothetical protein M421DRAFT_421622 [Didymella exigua CBS 183.55]
MSVVTAAASLMLSHFQCEKISGEMDIFSQAVRKSQLDHRLQKPPVSVQDTEGLQLTGYVSSTTCEANPRKLLQLPVENTSP